MWRYNQHYFDFLHTNYSSSNQFFQNKLLINWVKENKNFRGVGWEPYPSSIRIVNWIKWHLLGNDLPKLCLQSLALQARMLNKRVEWNILGNHLFSNAKALIYAGIFFSDKDSKIWLKKGLKIISEELDEQILKDGGNFELSPMYHAIFLEDILDLINISKLYNNVIQDENIENWKNIVKKMLKWLETMIHPDGEISFFNDATIGNAANFKDLKSYADELGIKHNNNKFDKITHLIESGYIRYTSNAAVVFFDVGQIGPNYLPGHAHADSLSFEMSLFSERLIVNGGTSEYSNSNVRKYERSTEAHNTVTINDKNSSEVWKSFRVARRALPFDFKIEEYENTVDISCSHDGYKRLTGRPIHKRILKLSDYSVVINDTIFGPIKNAYSSFHFHPNVQIFKIQNNFYKINMPNNKKVILKILKGDPIIKKSYYSPEFGKRLETNCLKVVLDINNGSSVQISWNN